MYRTKKDDRNLALIMWGAFLVFMITNVILAMMTGENFFKLWNFGHSLLLACCIMMTVVWSVR